MTAEVLDGKLLAANIKKSLARTVDMLALQCVKPTLAIVQAGNDPASGVYVRGKLNDCIECGIEARHIHTGGDVDTSELLDVIAELNDDRDIDGIIVQLPLPEGIDTAHIAEAIHPAKDVDGFHPYNRWRTCVGDPLLEPCTPAGVMRMLNNYNLVRPSLNAVVVGRSQIVGMPMAEMLTHADMTVTLMHSKTDPDAFYGTLRRADIVISAVGKPGLISGAMIKPGAVLVDVGITRGADGMLHGDFADDVWDVASWVTPVPGGVGPMTRAMLMCNVVKATGIGEWAGSVNYAFDDFEISFCPICGREL